MAVVSYTTVLRRHQYELCAMNLKQYCRIPRPYITEAGYFEVLYVCLTHIWIWQYKESEHFILIILLASRFDIVSCVCLQPVDIVADLSGGMSGKVQPDDVPILPRK